MKLTVIEGGAHSIAWKHADQVTKKILGFFPDEPGRVLRPHDLRIHEERNF